MFLKGQKKCETAGLTSASDIIGDKDTLDFQVLLGEINELHV